MLLRAHTLKYSLECFKTVRAGVAGVVDVVFAVATLPTGTAGVETIGVWSSSVRVEEISGPSSCRIYLPSTPRYIMKSQPTCSMPSGHKPL